MSPSARKCATVRISPTALDIPKRGRHPDRDFLRRGDAGEVELVDSALPFDDFDASQYRASPMLGAHTLKVLARSATQGCRSPPWSNKASSRCASSRQEADSFFGRKATGTTSSPDTTSAAMYNRHGIPAPPEAVHRDTPLARSVGVPEAHDCGPSRISWLSVMLANWIGDRGRVKLTPEAVYQRGQVTDKGYAAVLPPLKAPQPTCTA